MNARRAARELALFTLYQMEKAVDAAAEAREYPKHSLQAMTMATVRALSLEARAQIEEAAGMLADVNRSLLTYEMESPVNLESPLDAAIKPVPIPTTRAMVDQIESCLHAAELLHEALRVPELVALMPQEEVRQYGWKLVSLVTQHQAELDEMLNRHLEDWRMDRIVKMDACLLRLACAEMRYVPSVDLSVSINEAVDLARLFSEEDSHKLINGVLGSLADELSNAGEPV